MSAGGVPLSGKYLPIRSGPVPVSGVQLTDRAALDHWLEALPEPLIAADLSLGAWRPGHLAVELAAQLGISVPEQGSSALPLPADGVLDADTVGHWVDAETRGDPAIQHAYEAVQALMPALGQVATILVVVPAGRERWRDIDRWTLRFLATAVERSDCRLIVVGFGADPVALPADMPVTWEMLAGPSLDPRAAALLDLDQPVECPWLGLVPGVLAAPLVAALKLTPDQTRHLVILPSGIGLVPPELRRQGIAAGEAAFSDLSARSTAIPWLHAYAAVRSASPAANKVVLDQAWRAFGAGVTDLAIDLADHVVETASAIQDQINSLLSVQTMRLVVQDYHGLANAKPAPARAPAADHRRFDRFRAWGRALIGDGEGALALFGDRPSEAALDGQVWLDLYLRNIHALALFRVGRADDALDVERDIARRLDDQTPRSWHLTYLNALNLSRLYRTRGEIAEARHWFAIAEASTTGVALPADSLHFQVLHARLAVAEGDEAMARRHWIAAALIFAALPLPQVMGWRVATAILGKRVHDIDPEALADVFLERLGVGANAPAPISDAVSAIMLIAPSLPRPPVQAVGAPGWGVLMTDGPTIPAYDGPRTRLLRGALADLIGIDRQSAVTLWVDLRKGLGLPETLETLIDSALWHGAERLVWDGDAVDLDGVLETAEQRVRLSPGVSLVTAPTVVFKRYRQPLALAEAVGSLDTFIDRAVEDLTDDQQRLAVNLVNAGVLAIETRLDTQAPVQAGDARVAVGG